MSEIHYHVLAPHRDDALLIFGGFLIQEKERGAKVSIHTIFSFDGYMRDDFKNALIEHRDHANLLKYLMSSEEGHSISSRIDNILSSTASLQEKELKLSVLIRAEEDRLICNKLGFNLFSYNLYSAFPLRGYPDYDAPLQEEDARKQLAILNGNTKREDTCLFHRLSNLSDSDDNIILAPAGIGGHPDHIIAARFAISLQHKLQNKIKLIFGQDLPYALSAEGFKRSELDFSSYQTRAYSISTTFEQKLKMLSNYKSQFSSTHIQMIGEYARALYLLNPGLQKPLEIYNQTDQDFAIEVQYSQDCFI